jgi:hypothetical protein
MKKVVALIIAVIIGIVCSFPAEASTNLSKSELESYLDVISTRQLNTVKNPTYGSVGGEWTIIGLARYGTITEEYMSTYKDNLKKSLEEREGVLSATKYTEYARVCIALTAIEENPESFCNYNLLKPLSEYDKVAEQGINGLVYTLIALDCGDYEIPTPKESYDGTKTTRELLKKGILEKQFEDGGWAISGTKGDADVTAMAITALSQYYKKDSQVKTAIDAGLKFLSSIQKESGGYATGGAENCESTAQVLTAIASLGLRASDKRFIKEGNTILDGLMKYYSDGGFKHVESGKVNQMATDQAMYALTAYYRSIDEDNGLYEMKDGITNKTIDKHSTKKVKAITKKYKKKKTKKTKNVETGKQIQESKTTTTVEKSSEKISEEKTTKKDNTETSTEEMQSFTEIKETDESTTTAFKKEETGKRLKNKEKYVIAGIVVLLLSGVILYGNRKKIFK